MTLSVGSESRIMARHGLIYGLGNLCSRLVGFLMIPVYTRLLTPADYGMLELVTISAEIISQIVALGISEAIYRFYFQYEDDTRRNQVLATGIVAFSLFAILPLLLLAWQAQTLARIILGGEQYSHYFLVALASIWFSTLAQIGFSYLRILKQSLRFLFFSICKLVMALALNIFFVVYLHTGIIGILYSTLISSAVMALLLVTPILRRTGLAVHGGILREMIRFGLPLIPASLGNLIVVTSDRYFLRFFGSIADTGLYSLAYRFSAIPGQFVSYPFMQIWSVRRMEIYRQENAEQIMGAVFTYFCLLMVTVALAVAVLASDVIMLMADPKFWSAYTVIPILLVAQVIFSFFQHFSLGIMIAKKTKYFAYIDGVNGVLNLAFNYFFIKKFGMMGAALATLCSYTLRVIMVYVITMPFYRIHFELTRILRLFSAAVLLYWLSRLSTFSSLWLSLGAKCLLLCSLPLVLYGVRFFHPGELAWLKARITKTTTATS